MITHIVFEVGYWIAPIRSETEAVAHDNPCQCNANIHHCQWFSNTVVRPNRKGRCCLLVLDQVWRAIPTFRNELICLRINAFVCGSTSIKRIHAVTAQKAHLCQSRIVEPLLVSSQGWIYRRLQLLPEESLAWDGSDLVETGEALPKWYHREARRLRSDRVISLHPVIWK